MPRARWWVIGALSVVTLLVVLLDATGVIFAEEAAPLPPPAVVVPALPDAAAAAPAAVEPEPVAADPRVVRDVEQALKSDALGGSVHGFVAPLAEPASPWVDVDGAGLATPASTLKLWTATAALDAYAPQSRLETSVVWNAAAERLVLVGGGDATLTTDPDRAAGTASLAELATATARALRREDVAAVRLGYDDGLFTGPAVSPAWEPTYVTSGVIAPVTALMADQGRANPAGDARLPDPALGAAESFAALLEDAGVPVRGAVSQVTSPTSEPVASVSSPPMSDLVERMLRDSDNQLAESLGRMAALAQGKPGSFAGAVRAIEQAGADQGVDLGASDLYDASGLSRDDTLPPQSLVEALHSASAEPQLASILSGLAVAGFDGTLADRFVVGDAAQGAGAVRAKTGTLTGISAEAGVATTCDGSMLAYAFIADDVVDTEAARAALDDAAAVLASCRWRR
ncbi:MAG: D-alanyl-D-alanine carboxypeptidase/D-alanyl-D-alanine-endopeptidase [Actinomycetia bacterium]|nr:D-alanyl-D-alanine carboxypeptidase/D-alanyl-D-alanine-endopeptidase [Actinomycetes bacterium]